MLFESGFRCVSASSSHSEHTSYAIRTKRGGWQQTMPVPPKTKPPRRGEKGEPTASGMMTRTTRSRSKKVEQHADQDAAMVLDKRCGDENSTAKPDSPIAGGTRREDSTVKKDDDDDDEDATSSKPDSPGAGDARRDDSSAKKDGDDNDDEDATAKPNSPSPSDESRDDSTAKKDDDKEVTATAKPHTTRKNIETPDSPSRASDLFIVVYD